MSAYTKLGFRNRREYLKALANYIQDDFPPDILAGEVVLINADFLGPDEDFDGLLSIIADYIGYIPRPEDFCN